jgi:RHS repeat-associated protein
LDRLTEVHDGVRADTYRYNGDGALVTAVRSGTEVRYVLDTAAGMPRIIAETNAAGVIQRYYIHGNGLLYAVEASDDNVHHYHYDAIGNTLALTNDTEVVTDQYAYGPYGETANSSGSTLNQFRYVGRFGVMKEDNGLMFMRARFYDSSTKRFMHKDPIKGSLINPLEISLYAYSSNNPIQLIDPAGTCSQTAHSTPPINNDTFNDRLMRGVKEWYHNVCYTVSLGTFCEENVNEDVKLSTAIGKDVVAKTPLQPGLKVAEWTFKYFAISTNNYTLKDAEEDLFKWGLEIKGVPANTSQYLLERSRNKYGPQVTENEKKGIITGGWEALKSLGSFVLYGEP